MIIALVMIQCKPDKKKAIDTTNLPKATVPRIDADSAYNFVLQQTQFGVRVPGTDGHAKTKDWIVNRMKSYGAEVSVQEFKASFLGKKNIPSFNIIAKINPDIERRVILFAHWDTRLIAEKDPDPSKQNQPIDGAIDGASGVAGLLEIARILQSNPINLGVDFVFFDAEDQGNNNDNASWCLGSQYWSKSVKDDKNKPEFGILLDLIGAKGATYPVEKYSFQFAPTIVRKVWALAANMGKSNLFLDQIGGEIMDDHYYVNLIAGIPTIDIIETNPYKGFGDYHHTHADNMDALDRDNLAAVIQVVTAALYKTSDGTL